MNTHDYFAKTRNPEQGFSLIEVLVSLTIVGISLIILLQIFSGGLQRIDVSEDAYKASIFARSLEARLGHDLPLQTGLQRGESDQGYGWSIDIMPYDTNNEVIFVSRPHGELYDITVRVTWRSAIREKELTLNSLRYKGEPPL